MGNADIIKMNKFDVVTFELPTDKEPQDVFDKCTAFLAGMIGHRKARQLLKPLLSKYAKLKEPGYCIHVLVL